MSSAPFLFDEFLASGKEESISPFLTPASRRWGLHLPLKGALTATVLLLLAFAVSFISKDLSYLPLLLVYFISGTPALLGAVNDIKQFEINISTLMTLAAFLSAAIGSPLEGALLLVLFDLSGAIEGVVSKKTKNTLLSLNRLSPRFAHVLLEDGTTIQKAVREISTGTTLLIKAGEVIPLDGTVIKGSSFVNLVHLTGESAPVSKKEADLLQAGSYNLDGALVMTVTRSSSDSTLSRIIQLVTEAQEAKPKLEKFLNRFGKWYATSIIFLFFLFAIVLPPLISLPYLGLEGGIYRALSFLIAASPCALIIATPTAYLSAISSCAKKGIILKGGAVLDALTHCKSIAFDKTGTLTTGKLHVVSCTPITENPIYSEEEAISIAAALEHNAVHPIAEAITNLAQEKKIPPKELLSFQSVPGHGLEGSCTISGKETSVTIGHADFIEGKLSSKIKENLWKKEGHNATLLLIGTTVFVFHFIDTLRPQIQDLIHSLKTKQNLSPLMLTGDHPDIAQTIAKQIGIEEVFAALRPEDKLSQVTKIAEKWGLIMVGDGINDAPALTRATVGISMGKVGSATAVDASDIVFLNDDLSLLTWVLTKAKKTIAIIKQNISLSLSIILFASTPALLGFIPLWLAVILHEGGTLIVGLNSLRLLRR